MPSHTDVCHYWDGVIQSNRDRLYSIDPTLIANSDTSSGLQGFVTAVHHAVEQIESHEQDSLKLYKAMECSTVPSKRGETLSATWPDHATTLKGKGILEDKSQLQFDLRNTRSTHDYFAKNELELKNDDYIEVDSAMGYEESKSSTKELLALFGRSRIVHPRKLVFKQPRVIMRKNHSRGTTTPDSYSFSGPDSGNTYRRLLERERMPMMIDAGKELPKGMIPTERSTRDERIPSALSQGGRQICLEDKRKKEGEHRTKTGNKPERVCRGNRKGLQREDIGLEGRSREEEESEKEESEEKGRERLWKDCERLIKNYEKPKRGLEWKDVGKGEQQGKRRKCIEDKGGLQIEMGQQVKSEGKGAKLQSDDGDAPSKCFSRQLSADDEIVDETPINLQPAPVHQEAIVIRYKLTQDELTLSGNDLDFSSPDYETDELEYGSGGDSDMVTSTIAKIKQMITLAVIAAARSNSNNFSVVSSFSRTKTAGANSDTKNGESHDTGEPYDTGDTNESSGSSRTQGSGRIGESDNIRGSSNTDHSNQTSRTSQKRSTNDNDSETPKDGNRKPKRSKIDGLLVCPFQQRDPSSCHNLSCAASAWRTVALLKSSHLARVHRRPLQCRRCWMEFGDDDKRWQHVNADKRCEEKAEPDDERISEKVWKTLHQSIYAGATSEQEKWAILYKKLFPNDEFVPSPYHSSPSDTITDYHNFYQHQMPRIIQEEVGNEVELAVNPLMVSVLAKLPAIVKRCNKRILSLYKTRAAASPSPQSDSAYGSISSAYSALRASSISAQIPCTADDSDSPAPQTVSQTQLDAQKFGLQNAYLPLQGHVPTSDIEPQREGTLGPDPITSIVHSVGMLSQQSSTLNMLQGYAHQVSGHGRGHMLPSSAPSFRVEMYNGPNIAVALGTSDFAYHSEDFRAGSSMRGTQAGFPFDTTGIQHFQTSDSMFSDQINKGGSYSGFGVGQPAVSPFDNIGAVQLDNMHNMPNSQLDPHLPDALHAGFTQPVPATINPALLSTTTTLDLDSTYQDVESER